MPHFSQSVLFLVFGTMQMEAPTSPPPTVLPVIVELFTSQGCSSCPPADKLLTEFASQSPVPGARVIPLSFHVDYWNDIGWVDPFSSPAFTKRQVEYQTIFKVSNIYTPQAVIGGLRECVGNDREKLVRQIEIASKDAKATISIDVASVENAPLERRVKVTIASLPESKAGERWEVNVAVTEDELVTSVKHGENAGVDLCGTGVVRQWFSLGEVAASPTEQSVEAKIRLDERWKREKLHCVAFVQSNKTHAIDGANSVEISAPSPNRSPSK